MKIVLLALFATLVPAGSTYSQTLPEPASHPLSDYVGTYDDTPGHPIEVVAGDDLFAVQDGAKYLLRHTGPDEFTTAIQHKIPFQRDGKGKVTGYTESSVFHARISTNIAPESAALAYPRPRNGNSPAMYHYEIPVDLHDGIAVGDIKDTPLGRATAEGVVKGILDGTYKDVHSVLIYQHNRLVMEEYFYGYGIDRPHQLRSATKSVVSALAGIAIDQGAVKGPQQTVLPTMNYVSYTNPDTRKAAITLGNLLSMTSGLDCNDHSSDSPGSETVIDETPDWVKATLDLPMIGTPGGGPDRKGYYCSGGVAVVGRMTENATHQKLPDFAQQNLFGPLGIKRADWSWNYDLTNADKEYSQIHLRPRDMLKLGMLYANGGKWQGRQVISADWVKASISEQSNVDNTGYGYFWWRPWLNVQTSAGPVRVDLVAAQGNGGQKIYLLPQYDLVAVFTAGAYNATEGAPPNRVMAKIILPALMAAQR